MTPVLAFATDSESPASPAADPAASSSTDASTDSPTSANPADESEGAANTANTDTATPTSPAPSTSPDLKDAGTRAGDGPSTANAAGVDLAPLAAGDEATLNVIVSQQTGTAPFDADDSAGHDSGASNDVVRTNDTVAYSVSIRYEGEDHTHPTIRFTLPRGQRLVNLPPYCQAGSSVTPATLPDPQMPLTATSWESLPTQEVVCVLADQTAGTSLDYTFVSQVRSEVPNGTVMDPVSFAVTSDQVTTPEESEEFTQIVSAAPRADLSKRMDSANANQGPTFQNSAQCSETDTRACVTIAYPVSISVPAGGKGNTPIANPISFEDNLDPASFYGAALWAQMVAAAGSESAAVAAYAPTWNHCSIIGSGSGFRSSMPYSAADMGGYANETNSVRDSGTISCVQAAPGEPIAVTITGADTSGLTVPSTTGTGNALPANSGYIVSFELGIRVPQQAVMEFGQTGGAGSTFTLATHNVFDNVQMTGIDGQPNVDDPSNNDRDATIRIQLSGSLDKAFTGIFGQPGNTPAAEFLGTGGYAWEGSPGAGRRKDGNTVVLDGQAVQSVLSTGFNGPAGTGTDFARTYATCDVWDGSRLGLAADADWHGYNAGYYPSNGAPVYPVLYSEGYSNRPASEIGDPNSPLQGLKIEYSTGPAGPGADSDCSTGSWYADPDNVPGVTKSTDADGRTVWNGINRVRATMTVIWPTGTTFSGTHLSLAIGQVVLPSDDDSPIGNWASQSWAGGTLPDADAVYAAPDRGNHVPTYDPQTHAGGLGDRVIPGDARVRVAKYVKNPDTGEFTDTAVPLYTAGSMIDYRLNPSLTGDVTVQGATHEVIVEDCLPLYQVFSAATQGGAGLAPALVQMGSPSDSELECPDSRQYVRWSLGQRPVGVVIDPIIVTAEVLDVARNGVYSNDVLVSSEGDNSPASARDDDIQVQLVVPTGLKISKTTPSPFVELNPTGVTNPRQLTWQVSFANIDGPPNVADVDMVDVLPADGLHGTHFTGTVAFDSASVVAGTGISILYTKTAAADLVSDPDDASNAAAGSTVWCDAVTGGNVVSGSGTAADCPANAAEVTGLRIQRPGPFTPEDDLTVEVVMTPQENAAGDFYRNIVSGRASGVTQPVGPARRAITIVDSSVGDRVWDDANGNGLQDDGEPGIPGWPVRLIGTDVDGNPVDLSTTTAADGTYGFTGLASGEYHLLFTNDPMPVNTTWTTRDEGADDALDSDVAPANGQTATFTLGIDTDDPNWDAGIVIDRNVDIGVEKRLVSRTPLDEDNNTTLTYDVEVTNTGTAQGNYNLDDKLQFGQGIQVKAATVANTTPGTITTNPGFNGNTDTRIATNQTLAGGASHLYRVTVQATLVTKITSEAGDCQLTSSESGTGFLNRATVTVDGTTSDATACDPVPPRRSPNLSIDKKLTYATPLDDNHRATVTYQVVVTNHGDGAGTYTLRDELQYSGAVNVDDVSVTNTTPGDIKVNPDFDGRSDQVVATDQRIPAGRTHEYTVTVHGQVSTSITTEQANCKLLTTEKGTGYLNEARLEVNGVITTDTACDKVPTPPSVEGAGAGGGGGLLPSTGGPAMALLVLGLVALLSGGFLISRKARG